MMGLGGFKCNVQHWSLQVMFIVRREMKGGGRTRLPTNTHTEGDAIPTGVTLSLSYQTNPEILIETPA